MMRAAELRPDEGYVKFLYLGQLHSGEEAVGYLTTAISIMRREREVRRERGGEETRVLNRLQYWRSKWKCRNDFCA